MTRGSQLVAIAAVGAVAVAAPATAKPSRPGHPGHPPHPGKPPAAHKCVPHKAAYIATGEFVTWTATQSGSGTWMGAITIHVTRANHHATSAKGNDVTYALANTRVTFGDGANPPAAGDTVKLIGKVSEVSKKCTRSGPALPTTVRKVHVRAAKSQVDSKSHGS